LDNAIDCAQRLLAAEAIEREHRTGEASKMVREQLKRVLPELHKKFRIQTCRAFDRVVLSGGASYMMEEQFQVPDEQILQKAHGQSSLKKFLEAKKLIYEPGDALDVNRFLKDVLAGATPQADAPDVYTAKAVHERFLGAPGLRLVPDPGIVRETVKRAVSEGKAIVLLASGETYDSKGCVEGPKGKRRRVQRALTSFPLDDKVLVAKHDSYTAASWVQIDKPGAGEKPSQIGEMKEPPSLKRGPVTVTSWDKIVQNAADRPLLKLSLTAKTPSSASTLATLAQPLGAENIRLSVSVVGSLKDSGTISFTASELKLTSPVKPLQVGQTLFNATVEGSSFEATLSLDFGAAGRFGIQEQLKSLADQATDDIQPVGEFDKPGGEA
jgi:hypothetical protein